MQAMLKGSTLFGRVKICGVRTELNFALRHLGVSFILIVLTYVMASSYNCQSERVMRVHLRDIIL